MNAIIEKTVREIAIDNPASVRVFETFGIDYCCGANRNLNDACTRANVPLDKVLDLLEKAGKVHPSDDAQAWNDSKLSVLADHIVATHHGYVRRETPRIMALLAKVIGKHGPARPEIKEIEELFNAVTQELSTHMLKEEQVLFPYIAEMELAVLNGQPPPPAFFGSVAKPIANMLADHDDAGALLSRMRELSNGYEPPANSCPTFRALYQGLHEYERDLHQHVHLENNILFTRAVEMENVVVC
jgi:regulator of cell morphogenesis and NO signaling